MPLIFIGCDPALHEFPKGQRVDGLFALADDEGNHFLAQTAIRNAHDGGGLHIGMLVKNRLHLAGRHIESTSYDEFLLAILEELIPIRRAHSQISVTNTTD